ncbi:MAG: cadherin-like beta sandwich domain-containing protein [Chloroflexota bacterium]|nr:cadherin-like beta sandwich domain-containing protein [Chloroflexota bacterium]
MKEVVVKAVIPLLVVAAFTIGLAYYNLTEASGHSAVRSISPSTVQPGGELQVTVEVANHGTTGSVIETIPNRFSYLGFDGLHEDADRQDGQTVSFIVVARNNVYEFTYRLRAPTTPGQYTFSGVFLDAGLDQRTVGGATRVTVAAPTVGPTATDAGLSSLSLTDGEGMAIALTDADRNVVDFASDVTAYYAAVDNAVDMIDVMATATDENAAVTGTGAMSLSEGNNTVEVEVTAADGTTTMTYTVVVTREESSDEARLLRIYDADGDGTIDASDLNTAIGDYLAGDFPASDMNILISLYLRG